ncbi:MAG: sugar nucleotide-binding protein, partial [Candidatus Cryptobacteroides sp.]
STEQKRVEKSPYPKTGIYHYSNEGVTSWYDFTRMIMRISNAIRAEKGEPPAVCDIRPCHSSEFPSPVTRPAYSVLDKTRIKDTFGLAIPYWVDSLEACIRNIADGRYPGTNCPKC